MINALFDKPVVEWNCNTNSEQLSKEKYNLLPHDVVTLDVDHDI